MTLPPKEGDRRTSPVGGPQVFHEGRWRDGHDPAVAAGVAAREGVAPERITNAVLEAEQCLLGCLLVDNTRLHDVERVTPDKFAEGLHGEVFRVIDDLARAGKVADCATVNAALATEPALAELGGFSYLFDLFDKAPPAVNARDYGDLVVDAWAKRSLADLCSAAVKNMFLENQEPVAVSLAALRAAIEGVENAAEPTLQTVLDARSAAVELVDTMDREAAEERSPAILCGLQCIDKRLKGLRPGKLIIIGGRPGMGKTALGRNIIFGAARRNIRHVFVLFSLEMKRDEISERSLSEASFLARDGVPYEELREDDEERRALLRRLPPSIPDNLLIDDRAVLSVDDVRRRVFALKARGRDVRAIVIDYLQLMRRPAAHGRNEASVIAEITQGLKQLAGQAGIAIILLSQLNRSVESRDDKRPQLSDLRESGSIEQDADVVLFPFRKSYYLQKAEPEPNSVEYRQWQLDLENCFRRLDVYAAKVRQGREGLDVQTVYIEYDHITDPVGEWA